jgi:hypothetical protein
MIELYRASLDRMALHFFHEWVDYEIHEKNTDEIMLHCWHDSGFCSRFVWKLSKIDWEDLA